MNDNARKPEADYRGLLLLIEAELKRAKNIEPTSVELGNLEKFVKELAHWIEQPENFRLEKFKSIHEERLQGWRQKNEFKLSSWEARRQHHKTMFDSVIVSGQGALKTCFLINGGASISMLAFIGHLATEELAQNKVVCFALPLGLFVAGIFCAGAASALTYFSQRAYAKRKLKKGNRFRIAVIICGIISGLLFAAGAGVAYCSFITW